MKEFADNKFEFNENGKKFSANGKKTLWEKEKLLITSNFSSSHSVLKRLQGLFGKGLTLTIQSSFLMTL